MKSPQKVLAFLEELQGFSDREITQALPIDVIPVPVLRMGLTAFAAKIPTNHAELDETLGRIAELCQQLRSDPAEETASAPVI